jgi:2-hydroxychromene-2-carboxylate isomerase
MRKFLSASSFEREAGGARCAPEDNLENEDVQGMGEVISLAERRESLRVRGEARAAAGSAQRGVPAPARVELFFDLACPFSYLAAERVERVFDDIEWTPASLTALRCGSLASDHERTERTRAAAERRALELRLPLVWPERFPADVPAAMRAASYAAEQGRGAAFALAAGRLAFCGGFDLDDPETLAEAAAAAGIGLEGCLQAVGELRRDGAIEAAGRRLLSAGANRLPVLRVGRYLFWGEDRVAEAAAAARLEATAVR